MKKIPLTLLVVSGFFIMACATPDRYNTQKGAALGAGFGALAGQAIGHTTQSTLIGTGVGALLGSIIGNGVDQEHDEYRSRGQAYGTYEQDYYGNSGGQSYENYGKSKQPYYGNHDRNSSYGRREPPPGEWVVVPGHWQGRRWVPAHEVWRPIDPGYYR
jgi:hypothetical protein